MGLSLAPRLQRGGANTKVPDMYGGGGVFSGPKTQK